jgi:FKBP-type peptidyl-prolyl cis-trans isomerase
MFIGVSMNLFAQQKAQAEARRKSTVKTSIKPKRKVITMDNGLVIEIVKEGATVACKKKVIFVRVHLSGTFIGRQEV